MNECLLVDMMGELSPEVFESDNIEKDVDEKLLKLEKPFVNAKAAKILVGVTAGSIVATAGILLAVKFHRHSFKLSVIQK